MFKQMAPVDSAHQIGSFLNWNDFLIVVGGAN